MFYRSPEPRPPCPPRVLQVARAPPPQCYTRSPTTPHSSRIVFRTPRAQCLIYLPEREKNFKKRPKPTMSSFKNPRSGKSSKTSEPECIRNRIPISKKVNKCQLFHPEFETSRYAFATQRGSRPGQNRFQRARNALRFILPLAMEGSVVKLSRLNLFHD